MPDNPPNDWCHLRAIGTFINTVGFPVAMACALSVLVWKGTNTLDAMASQIGQFHQEHDKIAEAMYQQATATRALIESLRGKEGLPPPAPPAPPP